MVSFVGNKVIYNGNELSGFVTETLFKKWDVGLIFFFWITRASLRRKFLWTFILILVSFLLVSLHNAIGAYSLIQGFNTDRFYALSLTLGIFMMITIGYLWYSRNRENILNGWVAKKIGSDFLRGKMPLIIIVIYLYVFLRSFILPVFEFEPWISFLFNTSAKILRSLGYWVKVEPFYLIGKNGTIYMSKGCLGFKTMLLFASVVYITGKSYKKRFFYIAGGLLFLNIVNIIRFVLLFIHIQKNGGYQLAIDLHEMYKYITYSIVFIMWVIWFERFSDIRDMEK